MRHQQHQQTPVDRQGDGNPVWNHSMSFEFQGDDCDGAFIEFDLRCEAVGFRDKTIGKVLVPIKDLMMQEEEEQEKKPFNSNSRRSIRFVTYQVRSPDGKPNGVLHLSYKMKKKLGDAKPEINSRGNTVSPSAHEGHTSPPAFPVFGVGLRNRAYYPNVEVETETPLTLSEVVQYPSLDDLETLPPIPLEQSYLTPGFYHLPPPGPGGGETEPLLHSIGPYCIMGPPPPPPPPRPPLPQPFVPYGYGLGMSYSYGWHDPT